MLRKIVNGTSPNEDKEIVIFEPVDNNTFRCYSESLKYFTITEEQKSATRKNPRSSPYMLIKKNERDQALRTLSIRKQCKIINKEAKKLLKLTDGKINLYRTGSVAKTSLQLFYDLCNPPNPDKIQDYEVDILEACRGALIYGVKYEGKAYKYDIVSEYPSIMASTQHKFPIKKGELKTFTSEEFNKLEFYSFGIYHVKVHNPDFRVFRENSENWYTHTDLNFVKLKLKLKITLIEDGEPNALLYDSTKLITASKLFGPFINYLFKFKQDGHKEVKKYLNCLWGALCKINTMKVISDKIHETQQILTLTPTDNGKLVFEFVKKEKYYESDFARIKPFMLSYGRTKIANIILPNIDKVVRVHTDGIISKSRLKDIELGTNLGDLKFEGKGNVKIINSNNYTFTEI